MEWNQFYFSINEIFALTREFMQGDKPKVGNKEFNLRIN